MSANSSIEWTTHTFNPWIGCTKVSPGCANCYAEREDKRRGWTPDGWGKGKPRKRTSPAYWRQALKWNLWNLGSAGDSPVALPRPRVFPSLCDWLDDEVPIEWLADFLDLIRQTPNLDWLLLTKRPDLWFSRIEDAGVLVLTRAATQERDSLVDFIKGWLCHGNPPRNVWLGVSVEDQDRAEQRIRKLLETPAAIRFLSCEPLLGPLNLGIVHTTPFLTFNALHPGALGPRAKIDWVIVGGESGPKARPCHIEWIRSVLTDCRLAGTPVFVKQLGAKPVLEMCPHCNHPESSHEMGRTMGCQHGDGSARNPICGCRKMRGELSHELGDPYEYHPVRDRKGGDLAEWPEDLRVRQMPG